MAGKQPSEKKRVRKTPETDPAPRAPVWPAYASGIALWASFPPLALSLLVWFAPLGWLVIGERQGPLSRREWWHLWLSGCVFWLAILQGIRLAYWPLYLGWVALSLYLAFYIPAFVGLYRVLRRRGFPLVLAAPVAWVGLEFVRSYALTGFSANMLGHTQAHLPAVIQIADMLGVYGLSFVIMMVSAALYGLATSAREKQHRRAAVLAATIAGVLAGVLAYGGFRLAESNARKTDQQPTLQALLVQENTPTMFDSDLATIQLAWTRYLDVTRELVAEHGPPDLIVWPESTFTGGVPWMDSQLPSKLPAELQRGSMDLQMLKTNVARVQQEFHFKTRQLVNGVSAETLGPEATPGQAGGTTHFLLGCDAMEFRDDKVRRFNSALFLRPDGEYVDRYDKMHLVMFGEYIPLGPLLQWLRDMFGLPGATPGDSAKCFAVGSVCVSPSICFESMLPRVIRSQVAALTSAGNAPDVLVNVTNDSWFRGSSMLDHHLACSILCAVENRRPLLVSANTGISAEIDGSGRVLQLLERGEVGGLLARPLADARWGLVQAIGYPLGWSCAGICLIALLPGNWRKIRGQRPSHTA